MLQLTFSKYQIPSLLLMTFLMVICVLPLPNPKETIHMSDKVVHVIAFIPLAMSLLWGFRKASIDLTVFSQGTVQAFLIATLYGGLIEVIQEQFVLNRHGDLPDFWADALGALIGVLLYLVLLRTPLRRLL